MIIADLGMKTSAYKVVGRYKMVHLKEIMEKKNFNVKSMVEDIVGCKWSLSVLDMLDRGVNRPGAMTREVDGLTTKVLNERLRKLQKYKIVSRIEYDEVPPRVEYRYTEFGLRFLKVINEIRTLEDSFFTDD